MAAPITPCPSPTVSCLVVSRTASLLNRLVQSLAPARCFWGVDDEILCSWNGSEQEEALILPSSAPPLRIANRTAYHFASNVNTLARQARGDVLVLLNDDVVLDSGSLDRAIQILLSRPEAGLIGGRLRSSDGRLGHAGILFSNQSLPYNRFRPDRLGHLIDPDDLAVQESGPMPAVTGALMVLRRADMLEVPLREDFSVCGEDVALCLDLRVRLGTSAYYAGDVTATHDEKSTRGTTLDHFDLRQVARLVDEQLRGDPAWRACQAYWATQEADLLEAVIHRLRDELARQHEQATEAQHQWGLTLEAVRRDAEQERESLGAELAWLREQLDVVHAEQDRLTNSSSWRLTAPWRRLERFVQRWRPRT